MRLAAGLNSTPIRIIPLLTDAQYSVDASAAAAQTAVGISATSRGDVAPGSWWHFHESILKPATSFSLVQSKHAPPHPAVRRPPQQEVRIIHLCLLKSG